MQQYCEISESRSDVCLMDHTFILFHCLCTNIWLLIQKDFGGRKILCGRNCLELLHLICISPLTSPFDCQKTLRQGRSPYSSTCMVPTSNGAPFFLPVRAPCSQQELGQQHPNIYPSSWGISAWVNGLGACTLLSPWDSESCAGMVLES